MFQLSATIKQINVPVLSGQEKCLLDRLLPEFLRQNDPKSLQALSDVDPAQTVVMTPFGLRDLSMGRMRRFSGGRDLPPGRYYSVCNNDQGNDLGTMRRELYSYWSCNGEAKVFPFIFDTRAQRGFEDALQSVDDRDSVIERTMKSVTDEMLSEPHLLIVPIGIDGSGNVFGIIDEPVALQVSIHKIQCAKCLDLRKSAHQEFFFREIVKLPKFSYTEAYDVRHNNTMNFVFSLPTLVNPELGGDMFHEHVGALLRTQGFDGLVFPSARSNSGVESREGQVLQFKGWNFVDYRTAAMPEREFENRAFPLRWLEDVDLKIEIATVTSPGNTGFFVSGIEAAEHKRLKEDAILLAKGQRHRLDGRLFGRGRSFQEFLDAPVMYRPKKDERR